MKIYAIRETTPFDEHFDEHYRYFCTKEARDKAFEELPYEGDSDIKSADYHHWFEKDEFETEDEPISTDNTEEREFELYYHRNEYLNKVARVSTELERNVEWVNFCTFLMLEDGFTPQAIIDMPEDDLAKYIKDRWL